MLSSFSFIEKIYTSINSLQKISIFQFFDHKYDSFFVIHICIPSSYLIPRTHVRNSLIEIIEQMFVFCKFFLFTTPNFIFFTLYYHYTSFFTVQSMINNGIYR